MITIDGAKVLIEYTDDYKTELKESIRNVLLYICDNNDSEETDLTLELIKFAESVIREVYNDNDYIEQRNEEYELFLKETGDD